MHGLWRSLLVAALLCTGFSGSLRAEQAVTTADPTLPVAELELRLKPLTRAQLKVEADGWLQLLQAKVKEISTAEIAVKYKKEELTKADEVKDALATVEKAEQAAASEPGDKKAVEKLEKAKQEFQQTLGEAKQTAIKSRQDKEVQEVTQEALSEVEAAGEKAAAGTAVCPARRRRATRRQ